MTVQDDLVSVIIPAYDAEATLAATIDSVRRQTHAKLEIVVVDDGSTDATGAVARAAAAADPRVRVVATANGGVARARNAGVAASRGAFVAPIDADDLWHPEKIARQLEVMRAGGPEMGFVYSPHRRIDGADRVLLSSTRWNVEGRAFLRSILLNFVGNGSSLLMRREAFERAGGYEPDLHDRGAQGCEDFLLQILIARDWTVGSAPDYLVGYRRTPGAMSADLERMQRSHLLALEHVRRRVPDAPADLIATAQAAELARLTAHHLVHLRRPLQAARRFREAARLDPGAALTVARASLWRSIRGGALRRLRAWLPKRGAVVLCRFDDADPGQAGAERRANPLQARIDALAAAEDRFPVRRAAAAGVTESPQGGDCEAPACTGRLRAARGR